MLPGAGRESEQGALLRGRSRLRDLQDARERSASGEVEMTEFERPQLGHAGARGGELSGSEPTPGARLVGLGEAAGHHTGRQTGAEVCYVG